MWVVGVTLSKSSRTCRMLLSTLHFVFASELFGVASVPTGTTDLVTRAFPHQRFMFAVVQFEVPCTVYESRPFCLGKYSWDAPNSQRKQVD